MNYHGTHRGWAQHSESNIAILHLNFSVTKYLQFSDFAKQYCEYLQYFGIAV